MTETVEAATKINVNQNINPPPRKEEIPHIRDPIQAIYNDP